MANAQLVKIRQARKVQLVLIWVFIVASMFIFFTLLIEPAVTGLVSWEGMASTSGSFSMWIILITIIVALAFIFNHSREVR